MIMASRCDNEAMSAPPPLPGRRTLGCCQSPIIEVLRLPYRSISAPPMKPSCTSPAAIKPTHCVEQLRSGRIANSACFEEADAVWRVGVFGEGEGQQWEAHPDKDILAIMYLSGCADNHQFSGSVIHVQFLKYIFT